MTISATVPTYRQLDPSGFFCPDGYLIEEGKAFEFDGEPNTQMEALNEPARKKLVTYYAKLDEGLSKLTDEQRHTYSEAQYQPKIGEATADARKASLIKGDGGIPLLGGTQTSGKSKIKEVKLPESEAVIRSFTAIKE
ncbi:MAG: hypothetical protein KGJ90_05070 [Patescibacteria group bacterium]|nr:hypothetical protein [Patescibacteria group bacterium]